MKLTGVSRSADISGVSSCDCFLKMVASALWCGEDDTQKWPLVSVAVVSGKVMQLHNTDLGGEGKGSFHAGEKWFECCQKQKGQHSVKWIGESAYADNVADTKNPEHFRKIVVGKEYLAQHFIDIDDTGLNFKHEMEMYGTIQGGV